MISLQNQLIGSQPLCSLGEVCMLSKGAIQNQTGTAPF